MRVLLLLLAICLGPEPAAAQRLEPSRFPHQVTARMPSPPNASARTPAPPATTATLALAGIFSGAVGLYLGSEVGGWIQRDSCQDCIEWRGVGAIGAESSAIPLAIHFANGRRGRVLPALAASVGVGVVGTAAALEADRLEILLAVPVLQIVSSIVLERATARGP